MLKPKVKKGLVFRQEDEGGFLFNPDSGDIKILNRVGVFIWQLLDGKKTSLQIAGALVKHFSGVKIKGAEKDLERFLKELRNFKLLE